MRRLTIFVLVATNLLACGGRVEGPTESGGSGGSGSQTSGGPNQGVGGGLTGGSEPLPQCQPGFLPGTSTEPCNWMYDGRCYVERIGACACACPPKTATICQSSIFDDPPVEVFCY